MKLKFFGDVKDFFKYDILIHILNQNFQNKMLFIPMLTSDNNTNYGNDRILTRGLPGSNNILLKELLLNCNTPVNIKYYVKTIKKIFGNSRLNIVDDYYMLNSKKEYYDKCLRYIKDCNIIFIDPDTGIEPQNYRHLKNKEEYIEYNDLNRIISHASNEACVIIIQFHKNIKTFYKTKFKLFMKNKLQCCAIANSHVAFFFLFKKSDIYMRYIKYIDSYIKSYPKIVKYDSKDFEKNI